jgi:uncharacterized protein YggU (UPF0235/DUF167 family)
VLLRLKVVPGASASEVVGRHGDRLKVRVSAAPEAGAANRAVLELLAVRLGVSPRSLTLAAGAGAPLKTVCVHGLTLADVARALDLP